MRFIRAYQLAIFAIVGVAALGCKQNPFAPTATGTGAAGTPGANTSASATPATAAQQQALASQMQDLSSRLSQLDNNNSDLHRQLAQAEQQRQAYQEQVALLQKQLGDMAGKVKETQMARQEADRQLVAIQASSKQRGSASITANNSARSSLATVNIPGLEVRQEGDVIRIEIPSDQVFAPGTAQMQQASTLLDEVAGAIQRTYPRQRVVIEAHADGANGSAGSVNSHLLTANQVQAVFQQFVQRNRLPSRQLSMLSMGDNHPLASAGTAAGQAKNRRIEVVIYPDTFE